MSELQSDLDASAAAAARALGMGDTLFKNVPVGGRFVFNRADMDRPHCILVRTAKGYRHKIGGRQWSTGARTAVWAIRVGGANG